MITLKDDFVNLTDFTNSGLTFIPNLNFADSVGMACKYCSSFKDKKEITV